MVRELIIELYLFLFKMLFLLFKPLEVKDKVTFVVTFGQNSIFVYEEMLRQKTPYEAVFLRKKSCSYDFSEYSNTRVINFETKNPLDLIKSIYHLATSKYVIIDNYYAFLSVVTFKQEVQCIQLWHAAGAIKTFGLRDQSIKVRSKRANERFLKVYKQFHKIVVGSDALANIFIEAFNLPAGSILTTGIPRTDLFYDKGKQTMIKSALQKENEALKSKKVILYAPTFRDHELVKFNIKLDLDLMYEELADEYSIIIKLHPAIKEKANLEDLYPGFVFDYSSYQDINELLIVADYLITDYSSIPYEFALLGKPMIFFPYDLDEYMLQRGLWDSYDNSVPGPIVYETNDIISLIRDNQFDLEKVREFSKKWNKYSNGRSSQQLVESIFNEKAYLKALHG